MRVSIITVVLNGERVLAETLRSLVEQIDCEIEHIVIDGGSLDGTLAIVRDFPRLRSRVVSEADGGPYDAMNKGIALATGEIVAFLNAGDRYRDARVVRQVVQAFEEPTVDLVLGGVSIHAPFDVRRVLRRYAVDSWSPSQLLHGMAPPHPGAFYRKSVFDSVGVFDATYRIAGDFELFVRLCLNSTHRYRLLDGLVADMPTGGLSARGFTSVLQSTREMRRALAANGCPSSWLKLLWRLPSKWWAGRCD
jgi:glycosyltransferase involved in cell wall biosynthesis